MKIGIVGPPQCGKSTVFKLLTQVESSGTRVTSGVAQVPDFRVDTLAAMYKPKKTTNAAIEFVDIAGLVKGQVKQSTEFLSAVRDVDAVIQTVRAFRSDIVPTVDGEVNPLRDLLDIQSELILTDWSLLETRMERLERDRHKTTGSELELAVLAKCRSQLEAELPLRSLVLAEEEERLIQHYDFFTQKPLLVVVNVDEDQMQTHEYPHRHALYEWTDERSIPVIEISGQVEMEISELDSADRETFLAEIGLEETGVARLAQAAYAHLGLISFFTVGEDEVKAWTIRSGTNARHAAGKIHSDIERGFIRAEVTAYEALVEFGSMTKVKENGRFRLEGKEYPVNDGDVISFRFNV